MTAYVLLILVVSSIPRLAPPVAWTGADKIAHLVEYGILGALLRRAFAPDGFRGWLTAIAMAAAIGGLDELYQGTVPGRFSSVFDWLADLMGASLGSLVYPLIMRGIRTRAGAGGSGLKEKDRS